MGERNDDLGGDAAGIGGEDDDAVGHQHRLLDVVGDHQDRLDRDAALLPEVEQIGAQGFGGQHVEGRKRFVHQQDLRLHDQRAGETDALPHAAGELLGIGRFEAVESDDVDRLQRALARLVERHALRARADLDVVEHGSHGNSAKLWNTMATPSAGPSTGSPPMLTWPSVGRDRPEMIRSSVDLPHPERPSSATISPSRRPSETLSSTGAPISPEPLEYVWLT